MALTAAEANVLLDAVERMFVTKIFVALRIAQARNAEMMAAEENVLLDALDWMFVTKGVVLDL